MAKSGFDDGQRRGQVRAVIYTRVSSDAQDTEKSVSLDEQEKDGRRLAEDKGYRVTDIYQDVAPGWSVHRPDYMKLVEDGKKDLYDVVIVWKLDRIARGYRPLVPLYDLVEYYGVKIEGVKEMLEAHSLGFAALVGKMEVDTLRERTSMGRRGAAIRGRVPLPQLLYGYSANKDGLPQINEDEATIVREIYRLSTEENLGHRRIADTLNRSGIPSPGAGKLGWSIGRISDILANRTYHTGKWYYGRTKNALMEKDGKIVRHLIPQPRASWIEIEFPVIVSVDLWREARRRIKERTRFSPRNTKTQYLLQRMVRCDECNLSMNVRTQTSPGKKGVPPEVKRKGRRYYICGGMYRGDYRCRPTAVIPADLLERVVWNEFTRIIVEPDIMIEGVASQSEASQEAFSKLCMAIEKKTKERENAEKEAEILLRQVMRRELNNNLHPTYVDGIIERVMREVTARIREAEEELEELRRRQDVAQQRMSPDHFRLWAKNIEGTLDNLDHDERQSLLRTVIEDITIDGNNCVTITAAVPVKNFVSSESRTSSRPNGARYDRRR